MQIHLLKASRQSGTADLPSCYEVKQNHTQSKNM